MSLTDFELQKEFGKGAFSSVCLVTRKHDNKTYAMKRVKIHQLNSKEKDNALNEVRILASITHPNIIEYKEAFFDEDSKTLNLVMEYADDGDMEMRIKKHIKNKTLFNETEMWKYLTQMTLGLKSLHDSKIMHRDLKSANVFIKENTIKLGDLNVSKVVKMGLAYTQTGTPYYASPEVWNDKPYEYKSDIWSLGCVLYEMCSLKPPFKGHNLDSLFKNVMKGMFDPLPSCFSKELWLLISSMLKISPLYRPNCETILNHYKVKETLISTYSDDELANLGFMVNEGKIAGFKKNNNIGNPDNNYINGSNCYGYYTNKKNYSFFNRKDDVNNALLNTIKFPKNLSDMNSRLPKKKNYENKDTKTISNSKKDISNMNNNTIDRDDKELKLKDLSTIQIENNNNRENSKNKLKTIEYNSSKPSNKYNNTNTNTNNNTSIKKEKRISRNYNDSSHLYKNNTNNYCNKDKDNKDNNAGIVKQNTYNNIVGKTNMNKNNNSTNLFKTSNSKVIAPSNNTDKISVLLNKYEIRNSELLRLPNKINSENANYKKDLAKLESYREETNRKKEDLTYKERLQQQLNEKYKVNANNVNNVNNVNNNSKNNFTKLNNTPYSKIERPVSVVNNRKELIKEKLLEQKYSIKAESYRRSKTPSILNSNNNNNNKDNSRNINNNMNSNISSHINSSNNPYIQELTNKNKLYNINNLDNLNILKNNKYTYNSNYNILEKEIIDMVKNINNIKSNLNKQMNTIDNYDSNYKNNSAKKEQDNRSKFISNLNGALVSDYKKHSSLVQAYTKKRNELISLEKKGNINSNDSNTKNNVYNNYNKSNSRNDNNHLNRAYSYNNHADKNKHPYISSINNNAINRNYISKSPINSSPYTPFNKKINENTFGNDVNDNKKKNNYHFNQYSQRSSSRNNNVFNVNKINTNAILGNNNNSVNDYNRNNSNINININHINNTIDVNSNNVVMENLILKNLVYKDIVIDNIKNNEDTVNKEFNKSEANNNPKNNNNTITPSDDAIQKSHINSNSRNNENNVAFANGKDGVVKQFSFKNENKEEMINKFFKKLNINEVNKTTETNSNKNYNINTTKHNTNSTGNINISSNLNITETINKDYTDNSNTVEHKDTIEEKLLKSSKPVIYEKHDKKYDKVHHRDKLFEEKRAAFKQQIANKQLRGKLISRNSNNDSQGVLKSNYTQINNYNNMNNNQQNEKKRTSFYNKVEINNKKVNPLNVNSFLINNNITLESHRRESNNVNNNNNFSVFSPTHKGEAKIISNNNNNNNNDINSNVKHGTNEANSFLKNRPYSVININEKQSRNLKEHINNNTNNTNYISSSYKKQSLTNLNNANSSKSKSRNKSTKSRESSANYNNNNSYSNNKNFVLSSLKSNSNNVKIKIDNTGMNSIGHYNYNNSNSNIYNSKQSLIHSISKEKASNINSMIHKTGNNTSNTATDLNNNLIIRNNTAKEKETNNEILENKNNDSSYILKNNRVLTTSPNTKEKKKQEEWNLNPIKIIEPRKRANSKQDKHDKPVTLNSNRNDNNRNILLENNWEANIEKEMFEINKIMQLSSKQTITDIYETKNSKKDDDRERVDREYKNLIDKLEKGQITNYHNA